jgi:hypothetical protein
MQPLIHNSNNQNNLDNSMYGYVRARVYIIVCIQAYVFIHRKIQARPDKLLKLKIYVM